MRPTPSGTTSCASGTTAAATCTPSSDCAVRAARCYRERLRTDPYNADLLTRCGEALIEADELPEAERRLRKAVAVDPDSWRAWFLLGPGCRSTRPTPISNGRPRFWPRNRSRRPPSRPVATATAGGVAGGPAANRRGGAAAAAGQAGRGFQMPTRVVELGGGRQAVGRGGGTSLDEALGNRPARAGRAVRPLLPAEVGGRSRARRTGPLVRSTRSPFPKTSLTAGGRHRRDRRPGCDRRRHLVRDHGRPASARPDGRLGVPAADFLPGLRANRAAGGDRRPEPTGRRPPGPRCVAAHLCRKVGQPFRAGVHVRFAVTADPDSRPAWEAYLAALAESGPAAEYVSACPPGRRAIRRRRRFSLRLADALARSGDTAEALRVIGRCTSREPENVPARLAEAALRVEDRRAAALPRVNELLDGVESDVAAAADRSAARSIARCCGRVRRSSAATRRLGRMLLEDLARREPWHPRVKAALAAVE